MSTPQSLQARLSPAFGGAACVRQVSLRRGAASLPGSRTNRRRGDAVVVDARLFSALANVASKLQLPAKTISETQLKTVPAPPASFKDLDGENMRVRTVFISDVHLGEFPNSVRYASDL